MKSSFYRDKWLNLKAQEISPNALDRLSRQIAFSFMDAYLKDCHYEDDDIELLCEMTTFSQDAHLNSIAAQALFGIIIESLCDDFEDLQTETYNRVMAQIVSFCRKLEPAGELDRLLRQFRIYNRGDLLDRIQRIRTDDKRLSRNQNIRKILLLSRVTIGADVAITSIIIQRLAEFFPAAELVLIGGSKLSEIFGGNPAIRLSRITYSHNGGLLNRLSSWQSVLNIIKHEISDCSPQDMILVDTDSRILQLGVLPIIDQNRYFFFDSRSEMSFSGSLSMAQSTNAWLDAITGEENFCLPRVWLHPSDLQRAALLYGELKRNGAEKVIALNFGVGGNPRKKVGTRLEPELMLRLLQEPKTVLLLDKGFGDEELQSSNSLLDIVKAKGYATENTEFGRKLKTPLDSGVVGLQTRIGEIAAVIANCDEYIGYDSACQHIAAAVKTPCLTIFAGSNNMRFIRRWSAFGPNRCKIVHVDTLSDPCAIDIENIINRIMNARQMRDKDL
jgi:ADP-heptose:LPS heptosyltransferase